jgi:GDPmannose 4,6-dehydratase
MVKKIALVFGASGQDGTLMCKLLDQKKYKVIGITRGSNFKNHKIVNIKVNTKKIDIYDQSKMFNLIKSTKCDEIYYFAGQSSYQDSFKKSLSTFKSHNLPLYHILFSVNKIKKKIKVFNACSGLIFDIKKKSINEHSNLNPNSPYGFSKLISYLLVKYFRENHKIWCMSGLLFNHESILRKENHVIPKIINYIKKENFKKKLFLGDINITRDWGWAPEYIYFIFQLMKKKAPKDLIIATGKSVKLKDVVKKAFLDKKIDWKNHVQVSKNIIYKNKNNYFNGNVDLKNLKKHLGKIPSINIFNILKMMAK